jgi:hypothetical protein
MKRLRGWTPEIVAALTLAFWAQSYIWPALLGPCGSLGLFSAYGEVSPAIGGGHGGFSLPIPYWAVFAPLALWVIRRAVKRLGGELTESRERKSN